MNDLWDSLLLRSSNPNKDKTINFYSARAENEIRIVKKVIGVPTFADYELEGRACWFGDHIFDRILIEDTYDGFFEIVTVSIVFLPAELKLLTPEVISKVCLGWTERNLLTLQGGSYSQIIATAFALKSYAQGRVSVHNLSNVVHSVQQKLDTDLLGDRSLYRQIEEYLRTRGSSDLADTHVDQTETDQGEERTRLRSPRTPRSPRSPSVSRSESPVSPPVISRRVEVTRQNNVKRQLNGPRSPQIPVSSIEPFKISENESGGISNNGIKVIVGKK